MIKNITRGYVDIEIDGKLARIGGEAYHRGYGSPDFVLYANSLERWEPPHNTVRLDDAARDAILNRAAKEMRERGMTVEIECPSA
ncbi:MAG: Imm74 family immunity protein [Myxococcota bacterium]|nr:Imm74 family immunity protein [Myxococcota bacterium]